MGGGGGGGGGLTWFDFPKEPASVKIAGPFDIAPLFSQKRTTKKTSEGTTRGERP